jgi:predicted DNA-binding protein with PD1-like motif
VNRAIRAKGVAIRAATFTVSPDPETNFSLFVPLVNSVQRTRLNRAMDEPECSSTLAQTADSQTSTTGYAIRVAPNIDICTALENFCRDRGITRACVQGGVGSTVGAVFDDGRVVEPFVTELLIRNGEIFTNSHGDTQARLDVSLVDYMGGVSEGRLARGQNPVLVTFELSIEVLSA